MLAHHDEQRGTRLAAAAQAVNTLGPEAIKKNWRWPGSPIAATAIASTGSSS